MKKQTEIEKIPLNTIMEVITERPNGTVRIQQDFSYCPTLTEQHTAHVTDINYLMEKYQPDELAAYIAARNQFRQEILGVDFSREPSLQDAKNTLYRLKQGFEELDPEIKNNFKNHVEFLKFIDNPANQDKMIRMGLLKRQDIAKLSSDTVTTTQEKEPQSEKK